MAAVPFANPTNNAKSGSVFPLSSKTTTDNLIWADTSALNKNRIVGPSKLWAYNGSLPVGFPENYSAFIAQYPSDGGQLASAGAFGTPNAKSPSNNSGWQSEIPIQAGGSGIENGYTYSLQQTAQALGGITPDVVTFQGGAQRLPNKGNGGFQGFYTYPQENILGGITYLADQVKVAINVGPLSSSSTVGTGGQDRIIGTTGSEVISGGFGRDRLTGQPTHDSQSSIKLHNASFHDADKVGDVYLCLRADSSLPKKRLRDVITDFNKADIIDLAAIDANTSASGHQKFRWLGGRGFTGKNGQLRIGYRDSGNAFLQADIDGDLQADFEIKLLGVDRFSVDNLVLS